MTTEMWTQAAIKRNSHLLRMMTDDILEQGMTSATLWVRAAMARVHATGGESLYLHEWVGGGVPVFSERVHAGAAK